MTDDIVIPIPHLTPELQGIVHWMKESEGRGIHFHTSDAGVTVTIHDEKGIKVEEIFGKERFATSEDAVDAVFDVMEKMGKAQYEAP